jgi:HTH-type transcriptional regulator / antitoxin HipB
MLLRSPADLGAAIKDERVGASRQWVIDVEKGKQGSELGLVFRALSVLNMALQIAESRPEVDSRPGVDIDDIVKTARKSSK